MACNYAGLLLLLGIPSLVFANEYININVSCLLRTKQSDHSLLLGRGRRDACGAARDEAGICGCNTESSTMHYINVNL